MARKRSFQRLPAVFKRCDMPRDEQGRGISGEQGPLEQYLGVADTSFDRSQAKTVELLDLGSIDRVPDRYLALLAPRVGQEWRSDKSRAWNRRKIGDAIQRWSYKGCQLNIDDVVRENGGTEWRVIDMASRLCTLDLQGGLGDEDCYLEGDDFYHAGAFVLEVDDGVDLAELQRDMGLLRRSGTRWYFRLTSKSTSSMPPTGVSRMTGKQNTSNAAAYSLGVGTLDDTLWLGGPPDALSKTLTIWDPTQAVVQMVDATFGNPLLWWDDNTVTFGDEVLPAAVAGRAGASITQ